MQVYHKASFTDFEEYKRTKNFIYILEEKIQKNILVTEDYDIYNYM